MASVLLLRAIAGAPPLSAQVPGTTVAGSIADSSSGAPISGALVTLDGARQVLSDAQGRFSIADVPLGVHCLRVQRYGYSTLEVTVQAPAEPLNLRLVPDPVQLEELTAIGNAKADVVGIVRDAATGQPVPWTTLTLTRNAVEQVGRAETSDTEGEFEISDIQVGPYLLRVERLGYVPQYIQVLHTIDPKAIEVRLETDPALTAGLAVVNGELRNRQASFARTTLQFDEDRLRLSRTASMRDFFLDARVLGVGQCTGLQTVRHCIFIDDVPVSANGTIAQQTLFSYSPRDFYRVDVFYCTGTAGRQGSRPTNRIPVIYAYTHEYMARLARRPRIPPAVLC